mmetsp:Transcript_1712/g.5605  ORF Transcript_1712/g.5605 Transcript_1712/m.5605 type:complete len:225 (+) Transcript_1712:110-784(+)
MRAHSLASLADMGPADLADFCRLLAGSRPPRPELGLGVLLLVGARLSPLPAYSAATLGGGARAGLGTIEMDGIAGGGAAGGLPTEILRVERRIPWPRGSTSGMRMKPPESSAAEASLRFSSSAWREVRNGWCGSDASPSPDPPMAPVDRPCCTGSVEELGPWADGDVSLPLGPLACSPSPSESCCPALPVGPYDSAVAAGSCVRPAGTVRRMRVKGRKEVRWVA